MGGGGTRKNRKKSIKKPKKSIKKPKKTKKNKRFILKKIN